MIKVNKKDLKSWPENKSLLIKLTTRLYHIFVNIATIQKEYFLHLEKGIKYVTKKNV